MPGTVTLLPNSDVPPEAWPTAKKAVERFVRPIERFLHVEASSGLLLLIAAVTAIAWANSPWRAAYDRLWETPVGFHVGAMHLSASLHSCINDGLMVVFFFVVGLEIRREMHRGELSDLRRAVLPLGAAVGGMLVPALLFVSLNRDAATRDGWGVPMATDIAFAVGVLTLLGRRVSAGLRILLLTLAIIDDIGAILVIALFYSARVEWVWLPLAASGVLVVLVLQRLGVRRPLAYVPAGMLVWAALLEMGIHPTLAGLVIGLLTPARAWLDGERFVSTAETAVERVRSEMARGRRDRELLAPLRDVGHAGREAVSPAVRLEAALHPWVAFGIMPIFALANAGVPLGSAGGGVWLSFAIFVGLVLGKPIGIVLGSAVVARLGLAKLPTGVTWRGILVVGLVSGIGFTMAIFIAGLAFADPAHLSSAKASVLAASTLAAAVALVIGRIVLPARSDRDAGGATEHAP